MKVLITGAEGQLGKACSEVFGSETLLVANREVLDITNKEMCQKVVDQFKPDVVIHAAAYTNVKQAEVDTDLCRRVNVIGTENMVRAAGKSVFVHVSTDYVFDGKSTAPYLETDRVNPLQVYGHSKLDAEHIVQQMCSQYFIIRTSWLFGDGKNFVRTMQKLSETKTVVPVVDDQIGCPTYTFDLAGWIKQLISKRRYGMYHASNAGQTSWAGLAEEIFRLTGKETRVEKISTDQFVDRFGDSTPRPKYSVLNTHKLAAVGIVIRPWQEALAQFLTTSQETLGK